MGSLTGNPYIDRGILDILEDKDVIRICQINKYTNAICDEDFWRSRGESKNPCCWDEKPDNMTYGEWYLFLFYTHTRSGFTKESLNRAILMDNPELVQIIYPLTYRKHSERRLMKLIINWIKQYPTPHKTIRWIVHDPKFSKYVNQDPARSTLLFYVDWTLDELLDLPFTTFSIESIWKLKLLPYMNQAMTEGDNETINRIFNNAIGVFRDRIFSGENIIDNLIKRGDYDEADRYIDLGYMPSRYLEDELTMDLDLEGLKYLKLIGHKFNT